MKLKNSTLSQNWLQISKTCYYKDLLYSSRDNSDEDETNYEIDEIHEENMNEFGKIIADHKPENTKTESKIRQ